MLTRSQAWSRAHGTKISALVIPILLAACNDTAEIQDPHAPKAPAATTLTTALTPAKPLDPAEPDPSDLALRRDYGAPDIKLGSCATLLANGSIEAKGCPNGIVTYGPYITAPADSNLSFTFDIKSSAPVTVGGDIISRDGTAYHAHSVMKAVDVEPGAVQHVEHQVHLAERAVGTEVRMSVQGKTPAAFTLSNIKIAVR